MATILDFQPKLFSFFIYKSPIYCLPSFESVGLSVKDKYFKIDFQDGGNGSHLRFSMETIFTFNLQVAPILPTKFRVNWPFGSGEEAQNRSGEEAPFGS